MNKKILTAFITILTVFLLSSFINAENPVSVNTSLSFNLQKEITVYNTSTTYNGSAQMPLFSEGDTDFNLTQNDLFDWHIYESGDTSGIPANTADWTTAATNVGAYNVYIHLKNTDYFLLDDLGNKTYEKTLEFAILPCDIESEISCNISQQTYTGNIIQPSGSCSLNAISLSSNDYYLTASKNDSDINAKDVGAYDAIIHGIGNYTGTVKFANAFVILRKNINENDVIIDYSDVFGYTGDVITPGVAITYNNFDLTQDTDYTLSYNNNTNIGNNTASIVVSGIGNFQNTKTLYFSISKANLSITTRDGLHVYDNTYSNGEASVIATTVDGSVATIRYKTSQSGEYTLTSIPTFKDVGEYTVYFKATAPNHNDYEGTLTIKILQVTNNLILDKNSLILVGTSPDVVNFTTTFPDDVNYIASSNDIVTVNIDNVNKKITLTPVASGTQTLIFTLTGNSNYTSATAELTVTVRNGEIEVGNSGQHTFTYDKIPHSLILNYQPADANITYSWIENETKHTSSIMPSFTDAGRYVITYAIEKTCYASNFGTATLIINPKNITNNPDITIIPDELSFEFDGTAKKPTVVVKDGLDTLQEGIDYILTYANNIYPTETAQIIVTGIGNYTGTKSEVFEITSAELLYSVTNGIAQYSGYSTIGEGLNKAKVNVESNVKNSISYKLNSEDDYNFVSIPRFINVGAHTVYFKIEAVGYETIEDTLTITITKKQLSIPEAYENLYYTGMSQSPSWLNYNSMFMEIAGETKATLPGAYEAIFKLNNQNVEWEDGTTSDKTVIWKILEVSIKDRETIAEFEIAYNEQKQISVGNGQNTFKRTGYNQIGWVESCQDEDDLRTCNYDRYIRINDTPHLNIFDIASSIKGSYVAKQVNYDNSESYDLYAVWSTATYKIKYELCDEKSCGTFINEPIRIVSYDDTFYVPNPVKEGYLFMGWEISGMDDTPHLIGNETITNKTFTVPEEWIGSTPEEKTSGITISCKNLTSVQDGLVTFKALWTPIKYRIVFDGNKESYLNDDGSITSAILSGSTLDMYPISYDSIITLNPNGFNLEGYTFVNWNTKSDGTGTSYEDEASVINLSAIEDDTVILYAQWERNTETPFTITYWKQYVESGDAHNSINYRKIGEESFKGETDSYIIVIPYSYKGTHSSDLVDNEGYIINTSIPTENNDRLAISSSNTIYYVSTTNVDIKDDYFYGFTPEENGDNSLDIGYKYIIAPNGEGNIDIYYNRNYYDLAFEMNGGGNTNPNTRQYGIKTTFANPIGINLNNGTNDFGKITDENTIINNSGKADFEGWFRSTSINFNVNQTTFGLNVISDEFVNGVDSEVTTDETLYAFWTQYRYSGKNGEYNVWTDWDKNGNIDSYYNVNLYHGYGRKVYNATHSLTGMGGVDIAYKLSATTETGGYDNNTGTTYQQIRQCDISSLDLYYGSQKVTLSPITSKNGNHIYKSAVYLQNGVLKQTTGLNVNASSFPSGCTKIVLFQAASDSAVGNIASRWYTVKDNISLVFHYNNEHKITVNNVNTTSINNDFDTFFVDKTVPNRTITTISGDYPENTYTFTDPIVMSVVPNKSNISSITFNLGNGDIILNNLSQEQYLRNDGTFSTTHGVNDILSYNPETKKISFYKVTSNINIIFN